MNSPSNLSALARLAAVWLAVTTVGGCACPELCGDYGDDYCGDVCYAEWPCFGYRSTCWRPWPGECITCPSPFLPPESAANPPPMPGEVRMPPLPIPMPTNPAPAPGAAPGEKPPDESSSRRNLDSQYSLGGLRWAPAGNP